MQLFGNSFVYVNGEFTSLQHKQVNSRGGYVTHTKLLAIVEKTTRKDDNGKMLFKLFNLIINAMVIDLKSGKCDLVKDRQLMWTTMRNLKMWFENWKVDLVEISFTEEDEDGNVSIKNYKLKDI